MSRLTTPEAWMANFGNSKFTSQELIATNRGWEVKHPDGHYEVLCCISGLATGITSPIIIGYANPSAACVVGDDVLFTVSFSEKVVIVGTPRLTFTVGGVTVYADYDSTATTNDDNTMTFKYSSTALGAVAGVTTSVGLNSGTIKDVSDNAATLTFPTEYAQPGAAVVVNAISISSYINPTGDIVTGSAVTFKVQYNKAVTVTNTPRIAFKVGTTTKYASYVSNVANLLTFTWTSDLVGIVNTVVTTIDLNTTGTIKDAFTNNASLTLPADYVQPTWTIVAA
jgi:hypothetical protein